MFHLSNISMINFLKIKHILLLIICFSILQNNFAQIVVENDSSATMKYLLADIESILKETNTNAAGLVLINGDGSSWVGSLGKANLEKDLDASENTMYRIGSVSKMFVSLSILKLQEEGKISLNDKVSDWAPEVEYTNEWEDTNPILIAHLLEHTTGWDDFHLTEFSHSERKAITLKEGIDFHPHSRISRWVPGTRASYCNSGPPVAAYIVEKITGVTFEEYVEQTFFRPIGMSTASHLLTEYYKNNGANLYMDGEPQEYWHVLMRPSGSINATPNDMYHMLQFFINRAKVDSLSIISEESLKRMERPETSLGGKAGLEVGFGLANYATPFGLFTYRSHNGGVNGCLTDFSYLPEHKLGYAFMITSKNGKAAGLISSKIRKYQTENIKSKQSDIINPTTNITTNISGYYIGINPRFQMFNFMLSPFSIQKFYTKNGAIYAKGPLGGFRGRYDPVSNTQYRDSKTNLISLAVTTDPLEGQVIVVGNQVLKPVSGFLVIGLIIAGILWVILGLMSIIYGMVWCIRFFRNKISTETNLSVRFWPFLSSVIFLALFILSNKGFSFIWKLGSINFNTMSIMILTILFAMSSTWSVICAVKNRKAPMNSITFKHSAILSCLHFIVTCYLLWHGVIGIQLWT